MMHDSFKAIKISERVYWVGAIDYAIRDFHGYSIPRGTTYNAFLILGSKPILVDTVKKEFLGEMLARIRSVIDPSAIEYIISNHAEMDHSGALLPMVEIAQPERVFASTMGVVALNAHFDNQLRVTEISGEESVVLGDATLRFIESRMLHWPDSMCTYFADDQILFTQDGFGMHLAVNNLFADQNPYELMHYETKKYYANILSPYSAFVTRLLDFLPTLNLKIKFLAPDHGPIWRTEQDISWVLEAWRKWAQQRPNNKVVICYDTMWGSTGKMAAALADGVAAEGNLVKVMPLSGSHRSDVATELLEAGAVLIGSPTLNGQMFPTVADLLCYLKGLKLKNLLGQTFGSFGWSGEASEAIKSELSQMHVKLIEQPVKNRYVPNADCLAKCRELGVKVAQNVKEYSGSFK